MQDLVQHPAFIPALVTLGFLATNLWVFFRREWESNHRKADYAEINYPSDTPSLLSWRISRQRLYPKIIWNKSPSHWQVMKDGHVIETVPGHAPVVTLSDDYYTGKDGKPLTDSVQSCTLRPLPAGIGRDVILQFTPISRQYYLDGGMHFPTDIFQTKSSIPTGNFKRHAVSDWVDDYSYIDRATLVEIDRMISDEMHIADTDNQLTRMEKIMHYMRVQLADAGGIPKNDFRWKNPFQIFNEMRHGTGKGWCTQNAQIFTLFANRAGVATRFVYCHTVQSNQFIYDGHSWTESYIEEQNRWVYSDPMKALVGVFDRQGLALNTADVFQLTQYKTYDGIHARIFRNWCWKDLPIEADPNTAIDVPFELVTFTPEQQFTPHAIIKYRRPPNIEDIRDMYSMWFTSWSFAWSNFTRYLWHYDLAYSNMPTKGEFVYRLRQSLFVGLIVSAVWLVCAS